MRLTVSAAAMRRTGRDRAGPADRLQRHGADFRETTIRDAPTMTTLKEVDPDGDGKDAWLPRTDRAHAASTKPLAPPRATREKAAYAREPF